MYERVVIDGESGDLLMEHQAFASLLMRRTLTLEEGSVVFKLFDLDYPPSTPDSLIVVRDGLKYLRIDCLREQPTMGVPEQSTSHS